MSVEAAAEDRAVSDVTYRQTEQGSEKQTEEYQEELCIIALKKTKNEKAPQTLVTPYIGC